MKKLKLISLILAVVMLVSMLPLAGMVSVFAADDNQVVADSEWYTRETTDDTPTVLEIDNASELFAFAEKLSEGTSTAPAFVVVEGDTETQLTVKLTADIILNDGWNAIDATKSEQITAPLDVYPIAAAAFFGGIFDGDGHVLSGLYAKGSANMGFFGNVATGYTATVQNVIIRNSFIEAAGQGVGAIWGSVEYMTHLETEARYGKDTRGTIKNVFIEASVSSTGDGKKNLGTGGFVGGARGNLDITDSAFIGNVFGGPRGVGGVIGSTYAYCLTGTAKKNMYMYVGGATAAYYYPTVPVVNVENIYIGAYLVGYCANGNQAGVGGIVGYANAAEHVYVKNAILDTTFGTEMTNDDGSEKLDSSKSYYDDAKEILVEERSFYRYTGYLYGHTFFPGVGSSNDVEWDDPAMNKVTQTLKFDNVYYVQDQERKVKYEGAFNTIKQYPEGWTDIWLNGVQLDVSYDPETGINAAGLYEHTNWDAYKQALAQQASNPDVKVPTLMTNIPETSYYGGDRTYNGETLYTMSKEVLSRLATKLFQEQCALTVADSEDWAATVAGKTNLDATQWTVWGSHILPAALAAMFKENMDVQGNVPAADPDWYEKSTEGGATELVIYNADDLLAFAEAINAGMTFEGLTVKLNTNIVLNEGWDAFAKTETTLTGDDKTTEKGVTAADIAWPVGAGKFFAGTFDGNGKTISGIYLVSTGTNVGIFGNVAAETTATIKNLAIVNSYVRGSQGTGGLFGYISKPTDGATVATKAIVDNVLANLNVDSGYVNATLGSGYNDKSNRTHGTGGLFGGCQADAEITNTVFMGEVYGGHVRGLSAFSGTATTAGTITIQNSYAKATLTSDADKVATGKQAGAGVFVGYVGNNAAKIELNTVVSDCSYTGTTSVASGLAAGSHTTATYTFANVTYVDYADDNATCVLDSKAATTINGTATEDGTKAYDAAKWATYGVNVVASADDVVVPDGWTDGANGLPLPTPIFNMFYTGIVGQSVSLGKELSFNIYVKFDGTKGSYEGMFDIGFDPEDGLSDDNAKVVSSVHVGNNIHKFTLTGIAVTDMTDAIAFADETGNVVYTSVKAYLLTLMDTDAELASAVLRYGAAVQTLVGDTDELVTEGVDLADEVDTTANLVNNATFEGTENDQYFVKGVSIFFENGVMMLEVKAYFYSIALQEGVQIAVEGRDGVVYLNFQNMTPVETETRTYTATFANIDVASMDSDITLVIKKSSVGDIYSQTMTTDMDDLIADFLASDADDAEKAVVKAMHAIGVALAD